MNKIKAGSEIKNKRTEGVQMSKITVLILSAALFLFALAPALFADQALMAKDAGSNCGEIKTATWTYNSSWSSITDPGANSAPAFVDYDADGDYEMILGLEDGGLKKYEYNASASPKWQEDGTILGAAGNAYYYPTTVDYDKDGDYDLLLYAWYGSIYYYENTGTPTEPSWTYNRPLVFLGGITGGTTVSGNIEVVDLNKDGYLDLIGAWEYDGSGQLNYYENVAANYSIEFKDMNNQFVKDLGTYTVCDFIDIDNEGKLDIICTEDDGKFYKFDNIGNTTEADWDDEIELLDTSSAEVKYFDFADLDNDSDYDIVARDGNYLDFYENTGTIQNPLYSLADDDMDNLGSLGTYVAPALTDWDNDGDLDLVVGDESSNALKFYNNTGNATDYNFVFWFVTTTDIDDRPTPQFEDIDNDNDYDLLLGDDDGELRLFRNTGSVSSPSWSLDSTLIDIGGNYVASGFGDIDADGDLDMVTGNDRGYSFIYMNDGTAGSPSINLSIPGFLLINQQDNWKSNFDMGDFDNDGDLDLLFSELIDYTANNFGGSTFYYENIGSNSSPVFNKVSKWFNSPYAGGKYTYAEFQDYNQDGYLDMIFTNKDDDAYLQYYENVGHEFSYNWSTRTANYLTDIGTDAAPYVVDFDGDNDLDIMVGEQYGRVRFYRNDGNITEANFTIYYWLNTTTNTNVDTGASDAIPSFADMDNDGDIDMIIGDSTSEFLEYWENNGTGYFSEISSNILSRSVGVNPRPFIIDLDGDGDNDLVTGTLRYVYITMNTGSAASAIWDGTDTKIIDRVESRNMFSTVLDINSDGIIDYFIGDDLGYMYWYKNYGTTNLTNETKRVYSYYNSDSYPTYPIKGGNWTPYKAGTDAAPAFGDFDNDGDYDLIIGEENGQLHYIENYGLLTDNKSIARNANFAHYSDNLLGGAIKGNEANDNLRARFYDLDNDNDLDVVVEVEDGQSMDTYIVWNQGNSQTPQWNTADAELIYDSYATGQQYSTSLDLVDFDNDGDMDIYKGVGSLSYAYSGGKIKMLINNGTQFNPNFVQIISGRERTYNGDDTTSDNFFPTLGAAPSVYFYDADKDNDMDAFACSGLGYCTLMENLGVYTDFKDIAEHPRFIRHSNFTDVGGTGNILKLSAKSADMDGDGDFDIITGIDSNGEDGIYYIENRGSTSNPVFNASQIIDNGAYIYPNPELVDFDNDGDIDIINGYNTGLLRAYRNDGSFGSNTCIRLINSSNKAESGTTVDFKNSSETICSTTTDSYGMAKCNINYNTDSNIEILVSGSSDPSKILVGAYHGKTTGSTRSELETTSGYSLVRLDKIRINAFTSGDYTASEIRIDLMDMGKIYFQGKTNSSGILDAWVPVKYSKFVNEPYTQNRITYDIKFHKNEDYDSMLNLNSIYSPNEINLSSATESKKLFKFPATEQMATGARYKVYVIYPAYTAQQKFNITDTVNGNLTIIGDITISYNGKNCTKSANSNNYSIDYTDYGCEFLEDAVQGTGDWVKVEYTVETPSYATFQGEGWSTQDFVSDGATIKLIS